MRTLILLIALAACWSKPEPPGGGFPVDGSALSGDAKVDGNGCPSMCTSCDGGICHIDTMMGDVKCPDGMPCEITCSASTACRNTIDCSAATSCTINCLASSSCTMGLFDCTQVPCTLYCRGTNSCQYLSINDTNQSCKIACGTTDGCGSGSCTGAVARPTSCSGATCL